MRYIYIIFLFSTTFSYSQKYDYTWQMGYGVVRGWGFKLDFNGGSVRLDTFKRNNIFRNTIVSISDKDGKFLFSSNGCKFFNKNLAVMENGDSLNLSVTTERVCNDLLGNVILQGAVALSQPDSNDRIFFVFHQRWNDVTGLPMISLADKLYYSVIDMNLNGGLGKVILKNQIIVADSLDGGNTIACKHLNGKDWWIITRKFHSNIYYTIKFTGKGIDTVFKQSIGKVTPIGDQGGGQGCFSPDGTKFVYYSELNDVMLYDFDRQTGLLSNFRNYPVEKERYSFGGSAFSPNSRFLYIFAEERIYQFDMQASDIALSSEIVAVQDGTAAPFKAYLNFGQLAPDCKIYFVSVNGIQTFGYIRYPDKKGAACQVIQGGIKLPYSVGTLGGLPNNPNYRLGTIPTYPCDSTIRFTVPTKEVELPSAHYVLYPNPTSSVLNIDYEPLNGEIESDINIVDVVGRVVLKRKMDLQVYPLSIDVSNLPSGLYQCVFSINGKLPTAKRFIIMK